MMGQPPTQKNAQRAGEILPGYPNSPHLYHLGEADFFLDHSKYLSLSPQQNTLLKEIKNSWEIQQQNMAAQISKREQALWQATASGQPDLENIKKNISDIEALSSELRLAFIHSVGKAVDTLTQAQVTQLMQSEEAR